jgi:folate-binding protein YgfZ
MVIMASVSYSKQIRTDRTIISIAGDGALAFLHNLLTCDLSQPKPVYGALLTPQGKILHDVFVVPDGDVIWIDVARTQAADLLKRLVMYRLRAKLDIKIAQEKAVAVSSHDDLSDGFADPRTAVMGWRAIVADGSLPEAHGYDEARIAAGLADSVQDIGSGELFVHEANLDQLHGVSFNKGCYVGQEVVSRTHHRHSARNRILPVLLEGVIAKDTDITSCEQRIGTMLSSVNSLGLALLRLDRLADATTPLLANGTRVHVQKPQWATFDVAIPEVAQ